MKWTYGLVIAVCILSLTFFPTSAPRDAISAQEGHQLFLPLIWRPGELFLPFLHFPEPVRSDNFADEDPVWTMMYIKDPKDGWFEHLNGVYAAHIRDNSAVMIASPGWRPRGDFKLEVDGRHMSPLKKTANGLGLTFSGDDEWRGFYGMMIAMGAAQNLYSLARWDNYRPKYLVRWRGANAIHNWDGTNRLMVVRIADQIRAYCNGKLLPGGEESDPHYGPNRLVGLIVTSFEFSKGEIEFDNFKLTPLYPDDFDDYLSPDEEVESYGFDTSPLPPP